jgi:hypothetical protein
VLIHIHAVVENSDHNYFGFSASSVENYMAALTELFVSRLYVIGIATYFRLASKQFEGIIKLLEVFIALPPSPLLSGIAANINNVLSSCSGEQIWAH